MRRQTFYGCTLLLHTTRIFKCGAVAPMAMQSVFTFFYVSRNKIFKNFEYSKYSNIVKYFIEKFCCFCTPLNERN